MNHRDNMPNMPNMSEDRQPILEDMINKILSMYNHAENNNSMLNENNEEVRCILRKAVGVAEDHTEGRPILGDLKSVEKEPTHLTWRLRKALDMLSDNLDTTSTLIASQRKTISEFNAII